MIEEIKALIDDTAWNTVQKNIAKAHLEKGSQYVERRRELRAIVEGFRYTNIQDIYELPKAIIFSMMEGENLFYGVIVKTRDNDWRRSPELSFTFNGALLVYLHHELHGGRDMSLKALFEKDGIPL